MTILESIDKQIKQLKKDLAINKRGSITYAYIQGQIDRLELIKPFVKSKECNYLAEKERF